MIQIIGLIVAVYCVARLMQAPLSFPKDQSGWLMTLLISIVACVAITALAAMLLSAGSEAGPASNVWPR